MTLPWMLLLISGLCYTAAFIFHFLSFMGIRENGHGQAAWMLRAGFLLQTLELVIQSFLSSAILPIASLADGLAFFAWALAFVYLVLMGKIQSESFGLILNPILLALIFVSAAVSFSHQPEPVDPLLNNPYFAVHIMAAFFAYASFALSFAAGVLFLIQQRQLKLKHSGQFYYKLPSLEELERLIYQPLIWGTPLIAAAVVIGIVWSEAAFGRSRITDPKTVFTGLVTLIYAGILWLHKARSLNGKKLAVWTIAAFSIVIIGFVGIRYCPESHHSIEEAKTV